MNDRSSTGFDMSGADGWLARRLPIAVRTAVTMERTVERCAYPGSDQNGR